MARTWWRSSIDIRPTDAQARLAEIRAAYPLMSVNELRSRYFQLPPVAWGNRPPSPGPCSPLGPPASRGAGIPQGGKGSDAEAGKSAIENELAQWERFALNRLDKAGTRAFEVKAIPDELAFEVSAGLLFARDRGAVRRVFAGVGAD